MQEGNAKSANHIAAMGLAALGVVFGDIGTSPLYTLKTVLDVSADSSQGAVFGVLSLVLYTLIIITSIKYVTIAMRVDNDGEGGILALMALLGVKRQHRPAIIALGLFGAALIYGDGASSPVPCATRRRCLSGMSVTTALCNSTFSPSLRKSSRCRGSTMTHARR